MSLKHTQISTSLLLALLLWVGDGTAFAKKAILLTSQDLCGFYVHLNDPIKDPHCVHTNTRVLVAPAEQGKYTVRIVEWGSQNGTCWGGDVKLDSHTATFVISPEFKRTISVRFQKGMATVTEVQPFIPKSDQFGPQKAYRIATVCPKTSARIPTHEEMHGPIDLENPALK